MEKKAWKRLGGKFRLPHCELVARLRARPKIVIRTDGRVVECARLESVCGSDVTVGSNPTLSAITPCQLAGTGLWLSRLVLRGSARE